MNFYRSTRHTILSLGLATCVAGGEPPAAPTTPETALVARHLDAHNARDLDALIATFGPDSVLFDLSSGEALARGTERIRERYTERFAGGPDLRATVHQRIALDNYVINRESVAAKTGTPPTEAIAIYYIRDKLIRAVWYLVLEKADPVREKNNAHTVEQLFEVTNTQDVRRILTHYDVDVEVRTLPANGVEVEGHNELGDRFARSFRHDAAIQIAISEKMQGGDYVVVLEQIQGSTGPQFEDLMIYDFKNGKIKRVWSLLPN